MSDEPWRLRPEEIIPALLALTADRKGPRRLTAKEAERRRKRQRMLKRRRRAKRVRERAARDTAAAYARKPRLWRLPFGARAHDRMLRRMVPGEWYGQRDIVRLAGCGREWSSKVHQVLRPQGLVERARNPAWRGPLNPLRIMAGEMPEPKYVYRLTAKGEAMRELLVLIE